MAARSIEPLVVGRVIGDVIDMFSPSTEMIVSYPIRQVNNGCEIRTTALVEPPRVRIGGGAASSDALYTLVMVDPDAPSPSEPSSREWVHWIVTDIPADGEASQGLEILSYEPPKPLIGIHRFVFILFKQEQGPLLVMPPMSRNNFSTREFAATCELGLPVAAVYFNAQKQAGGCCSLTRARTSCLLRANCSMRPRNSRSEPSRPPRVTGIKVVHPMMDVNHAS